MGVLVTSLVIQFFEVPEDLQAFLLAARGLAPAAIPLALLVGFYRQSELRQRALLDAIPDLMIRFTRDGHYLDVREEDSALIARPVDPTVSGRIEDLLPAGVAASLLMRPRRRSTRGTSRPWTSSLDLPAGRREFETRITPSGADEVTAIVRDFSEQRAAQEELRRSRAQDRRGDRRRAAPPRAGPP